MSSILLLILFPGDVYLGQHSFEEASRYYAVASSTAPSHQSYYGEAICALNDNELEKSLNLLSSIIYKTPEISYYLGIAYYRLGIHDKSSYYFRSLHDENRNIWQSNYYLGLINLRQNRSDEARTYFNQIPDWSDKMLLVDYIENYNRLVLAQQKYKEGKYTDAIALYKQITYFSGYREIGYALACAQMKEYKKCLSLLDSVIYHSDDKLFVTRSMYEAAKVCFTTREILKSREYLRNYLTIERNDEALFLLGKTFSEEALYDSAIIYFTTLPDSVDEYLFFKGRTEYFLGFWGRAEELLLRHREVFPNSRYGDRATFILASINFNRKEYKQAIDFWNELIALFPQSIYAAAAQKGIGDAYFSSREYMKSLQAYRMVKNYDPSTIIESQTTLKIYETLYYLKKYPSLIDALRSFVEENQKSELVPKTQLRIAKILFERKEYYQSLSELGRIIEDYPYSSITSKALIEKARIYHIIGTKREVKNVFEQLLDNKNAVDYHSYAANELGVIYFNESKYDSALYYYNLLLKDKHYREKAIFEIAKIYALLGQNKESETMIDKLIIEYPTSVFLYDAYILKTKARRNQGQHEEAIHILQELMENVGQKPEILFELGNIYFEIEDYVNARKHYLNACEYFEQKRDDAARALILAGDASVAIGDKKGAREYYLQANLIAESISLKDQAAAKMNTISE